MINFSEGVSSAKVLLIEVKGSLGDSKHKLVAKELNHGLAYEDTLRDIHGVIVLKDLVGSGTDGIQIGRDLGGLLELIDSDIFIVVEVEEPVDSSTL